MTPLPLSTDSVIGCLLHGNTAAKVVDFKHGMIDDFIIVQIDTSRRPDASIPKKTDEAVAAILSQVYMPFENTCQFSGHRDVCDVELYL